jgi:hypothetical protein
VKVHISKVDLDGSRLTAKWWVPDYQDSGQVGLGTLTLELSVEPGLALAAPLLDFYTFLEEQVLRTLRQVDSAEVQARRVLPRIPIPQPPPLRRATRPRATLPRPLTEEAQP